MNTLDLMDKQIMDLSISQNNDEAKEELIDPVNHPREGGDMTDEMLPNYDFQPIASLQQSNGDSNNAAGITHKSSVELKANSGTRNHGFDDSTQPAKFNMEKESDVYKAALISEIDRAMKKHTDDLMNVLEDISARVSLLENNSRQLENSVDDLKASFAEHHGSSAGKLRQIENIIREVQAGVQVVKDKYETMEAQLQLSKAEQPPETQISGHMDHHHVAASAPLQYQSPPQYQPSFLLQFSQPPPLYQSQPPATRHSGEPPYLQPPSFLPSIQQPDGFPPYRNSSQVYEPPPSQLSSGFSGQYPPVKSQGHTLSNMRHSGSGVGGSNPSSSNNGTRVPIDDVVDKVTSMGFSRDQVRAAVRMLTENGQAVDLNVVLDKLMTDGVEKNGPKVKPWFGR